MVLFIFSFGGGDGRGRTINAVLIERWAYIKMFAIFIFIYLFYLWVEGRGKSINAVLIERCAYIKSLLWFYLFVFFGGMGW